jgi:hypothetical protein
MDMPIHETPLSDEITITNQDEQYIEQSVPDGYRPVVSILHTSGLDRIQALRLHENASRFIVQGAIIGPCFLQGEPVRNAFSLYIPSE